MVRPSPFDPGRDALLRDVRGKRRAVVALERLVRMFRRGSLDPLIGPPTVEPAALLVEARRLRATITEARRAIESAAPRVEHLLQSYWCTRSSQISHTDATSALTMLRNGLKDLEDVTVPSHRPSTLVALRRAWLAEHVVLELRRCGENPRPARDGRLHRILARVFAAAELRVPNDMYALMRAAVMVADRMVADRAISTKAIGTPKSRRRSVRSRRGLTIATTFYSRRLRTIRISKRRPK